jgi:hypothetical protein
MADINQMESGQIEEFMLLTELVSTGAKISEASQGPLSMPMVKELQELHEQLGKHVEDATIYILGYSEDVNAIYPPKANRSLSSVWSLREDYQQLTEQMYELKTLERAGKLGSAATPMRSIGIITRRMHSNAGDYHKADFETSS